MKLILSILVSLLLLQATFADYKFSAPAFDNETNRYGNELISGPALELVARDIPDLDSVQGVWVGTEQFYQYGSYYYDCRGYVTCSASITISGDTIRAVRSTCNPAVGSTPPLDGKITSLSNGQLTWVPNGGKSDCYTWTQNGISAGVNNDFFSSSCPSASSYATCSDNKRDVTYWNLKCTSGCKFQDNPPTELIQGTWIGNRAVQQYNTLGQCSTVYVSANITITSSNRIYLYQNSTFTVGTILYYSGSKMIYVINKVETCMTWQLDTLNGEAILTVDQANTETCADTSAKQSCSQNPTLTTYKLCFNKACPTPSTATKIVAKLKSFLVPEVIGGVVGGVVVLAILGYAIWYFKVRKVAPRPVYIKMDEQKLITN